MCLQDPATGSPAKKYNGKEIVMMEKYISDFHTIFYITAIKKLAFHLPHIHILGTKHCGNTHREAFKRRIANKYVLCRRDYAEIVVASFSHQIQSGYYGGNIYVYIEVIALEHFIAPTQIEKEKNTTRTHPSCCVSLIFV